jgi:hypothetical protein
MAWARPANHGLSIQSTSHMRRLARSELACCSFSALIQLKICLRTAWLRVLNESVNLSRPTLFNRVSELSPDLFRCQNLVFAPWFWRAQ